MLGGGAPLLQLCRQNVVAGLAQAAMLNHRRRGGDDVEPFSGMAWPRGFDELGLANGDQFRRENPMTGSSTPSSPVLPTDATRFSSGALSGSLNTIKAQRGRGVVCRGSGRSGR